jgi:hypothetical protein
MRVGSSVGCYDFFKKLGITGRLSVLIYSTIRVNPLETSGRHLTPLGLAKASAGRRADRLTDSTGRLCPVFTRSVMRAMRQIPKEFRRVGFEQPEYTRGTVTFSLPMATKKLPPRSW